MKFILASLPILGDASSDQTRSTAKRF